MDFLPFPPPRMLRRTISFSILILGTLLFWLVWAAIAKSSLLQSKFSKPYRMSPLRSQWSMKTKGLHSEVDRAFHLLIPASETTPELCKTMLSATLLDYPPPVLVNFGKIFNDTKTNEKGSHTGKLRGVLEHLKNDPQINRNDIVLIVDGYDVRFQLPPEVMIERYYKVLVTANVRLKHQYGKILKALPTQNGSKHSSSYSQTVIFGADKACWPNPPKDPACIAVPRSTLPKNAYGPKTDKDSENFLVRPRYLNSGTVIGAASELEAIYEHAVYKVEHENRGVLGDQFVLGEIFGEQEVRRFKRQQEARHRFGGGLLGWLAVLFTTAEEGVYPSSSNFSSHSSRGYDFGIGLDYESLLFQTMTHSHEDLEFLYHNNTSFRLPPRTPKNSHLQPSLNLPLDIQESNPPFPGLKITSNRVHPFSINLDRLPTNLFWRNLPLATNLYTSSIPTLLHFNGDKSYLTTWWTRMWFHPYARALLRQHLRTPQRPIAVGHEVMWDKRGGKGGAWTDKGRWMSWNEVCAGVEDEVFGDGLGRWGNEEGVKTVYNKFGKLLIGEEEGKKD